ncbi:hypothetical protein ACWD7T_35230 [Streptomyces sp. 900116325]
MNRAIRLAALATAAALLVTGCKKDFPEGPPGRVVKRNSDLVSIKPTIVKRYLTTESRAGKRSTFRVSKEDFRLCNEGSSYPGCLARNKPKGKP